MYRSYRIPKIAGPSWKKPSSIYCFSGRVLKINTPTVTIRPIYAKLHTSFFLAARVSYDQGARNATLNLDMTTDRRAAEKTMPENQREEMERKTLEWEGIEQDLASPDAARNVLEQKASKREDKSSEAHQKEAVGERFEEDVGDMGIGVSNVPRGDISKGEKMDISSNQEKETSTRRSMGTQTVKKAEELVGSAYDVVAEGLKKTTHAAGHPFETASKAKEKLSSAKETTSNVKNKAEDLTAKAKQYYDKAGVGEKVREGAETAKNVASNVAEKAKDTAKSTYEKVSEMGSKAAETVGEYAKEATDKAKEAGREAQEKAKEKVPDWGQHKGREKNVEK